MRIPAYLKLFISIVLSFSAGVLGSFFTAQSIPTWYQTITKPSFTPPGWLFGPVWSLLYILMGVSFFLIWQRSGEEPLFKVAVTVFIIQLILNALWSVIFFGLKSIQWALLEIVFLWIAIILTIIVFYKLNRIASYLLIPYIIWVTFAAFLNFSLYRLN